MATKKTRAKKSKRTEAVTESTTTADLRKELLSIPKQLRDGEIGVNEANSAIKFYSLAIKSMEIEVKFAFMRAKHGLDIQRVDM